MDDIFQWLMLLFVIITSVFRGIKGVQAKKTREQLAAIAPLINAKVDSGKLSISGMIEEIPFKVELATTESGLYVILKKHLPFKLDIAERPIPLDPEQASRDGDFLLGDRKFDEQFSVLTNAPDSCCVYLNDPLFQQGVEFVISQGYDIRFTARHAIFSTPSSTWLADPESAAKALTNILQLGHSLIAEFE